MKSREVPFPTRPIVRTSVLGILVILFFLTLFLCLMAHADSSTIITKTYMQGAYEIPPTRSYATGFAYMYAYRDRDLWEWYVSLKDITGGVQSLDLHWANNCSRGALVFRLCGEGEQPCNAPVLRGNYQYFRTTSADLRSGTRDEILQAIEQEEVYLEVHSAGYPAGEIRGQMDVVP